MIVSKGCETTVGNLAWDREQTWPWILKKEFYLVEMMRSANMCVEACPRSIKVKGCPPGICIGALWKMP
jgi:hypothetical protein